MSKCDTYAISPFLCCLSCFPVLVGVAGCWAGRGRCVRTSLVVYNVGEGVGDRDTRATMRDVHHRSSRASRRVGSS